MKKGLCEGQRRATTYFHSSMGRNRQCRVTERAARPPGEEEKGALHSTATHSGLADSRPPPSLITHPSIDQLTRRLLRQGSAL